MNKKVGILLVAVMLATFLAACGATPEPETIVQTVEVEKEVTVVETVEVEVEKEVTVVETVEVEKEVTVVETVEVEAEPVEKTVVEFWTTDNEAERVDLYEEIAARYMAENPEIDVRIVPIEEAGVTQRMATALAANRPPDLIRMGVERVAAFAADEILDEEAAMAVIEAVGEDDFRAGPLHGHQPGHRQLCRHSLRWLDPGHLVSR
jgi:ABC-type glycerol-3-phosphate transport system substrate-binding protein